MKIQICYGHYTFSWELSYEEVKRVLTILLLPIFSITKEFNFKRSKFNSVFIWICNYRASLYLPQKKLLEGRLEYEAMKSKGGLLSNICDVFEYCKIVKCNFVKIGSDNITTVFFMDNNWPGGRG